MKKNKVLISFGERIRELRLNKNLSQEALSFKADLHRTYIGMIERAEKNITLTNIEKLAKALDVGIDDLFKEADEMNISPYTKKRVSEWKKITDKLIAVHPLKDKEVIDATIKSWNDIFNSKIGIFFIGREIFPAPQMMAFFLHELVAHNLGLMHPGVYKVGTAKTEKDIHCITDSSLSVEIKASSHPSQIFANRSYAQPQTVGVQKNKNGYYITINFEKFEDVKTRRPEILLIRFGYLEHSDWIAQTAATGQQARLSQDAYTHKLKIIYKRS